MMPAPQTTTQSTPRQPITMEDLAAKMDIIIERLEELDSKVDAVDARVAEINSDYGTGFSIDE